MWHGLQKALCSKIPSRASLVAQWLRVRLPMQGTQVHAPVQEDPICRGAAGPVSHGRWACTSGACDPQRERPQQWEACVLQKQTNKNKNFLKIPSSFSMSNSYLRYQPPKGPWALRMMQILLLKMDTLSVYISQLLSHESENSFFNWKCHCYGQFSFIKMWLVSFDQHEINISAGI